MQPLRRIGCPGLRRHIGRTENHFFSSKDLLKLYVKVKGCPGSLEFKDWRSQIVTSSWGGARYFPIAFTEQGVAMSSSVLNNNCAIEVNNYPLDLSC